MTGFALVGSASVQAQQAPALTGSAVYIVQMAGDPVATYSGGHAGIAATRPAPGARLDARSTNAKALRTRLRTQHDDAFRKSGVATTRRVYDYSVTFNGFAARLTGAEVSKLKVTPGVVRVWKNERLKAETFTTPDFLGLSGANGTWAKQFGGPARAGEGVIIGDLDSGIWAENPSFGPLPEPRPDQAIINAKWHGICDGGVEQPISCNNKLIGARWYHADGPPPAEEFTGPRDFGGHGSHTASTAAGNNNVAATINGLPVGNVSGMAPAARLAAYKVLWDDGAGNASGTTEDIVAAIDDAVADGVDIINYSISGSRLFVVDPVEVAFFNAAASGVFVSTSAGNNGDDIGVSSVAHNAPWTTTVAASTHDRGSSKTVTLGDGRTFSGMGSGPGVASAPFVDSVAVGLPVPGGANPAVWANEVELCFLDRLDPAKVTGKTVLCKRGTNARTEKSLAVKEAGGVGMVLYNPAAGTVNADFHFVPSIHVDSTVGAALKAYVGTAAPTAALSAGVKISLRAPEMGSFSSFGPALAGGGDLLKPDISAPGVDVVAAVAPPGNNDNNWDSYQGTSMAAPHISGIAALLKSKNQSWSPMWIKSAIMTTAFQKDSTGATIQRLGAPATPLNFGNGHVDPGTAFDPGLVYDSGPLQWFQYGCAIGQFQLLGLGDDCVALGATDASDLNYASVSIGDLPGTQTVTRTVTNVTGRAGVYEAKVEAPAGITVKVSPNRLVIPPRRSATFKVTFTRTDAAPLGQWAFGALTWNDKKGHLVRSALAVRPVAVAVAAESTLSGAAGSTQLAVKTGYSGTLTAAGAGLNASSVTTLHLVGENQAFDPGFPAAGPAVGKITITVPAGTKLARFATFDGDYSVSGVDLDLFVYQAGTSNLVASSAGGTAEESVTFSTPGTYDVYVVQFALPAGTTQLDVEHHAWTLSGTNAGNLTVTPASQPATIGGAAPVTVSWTGLTAGSHYLGYVEFGNGSAVVGRTILAANP